MFPCWRILLMMHSTYPPLVLYGKVCRRDGGIPAFAEVFIGFASIKGKNGCFLILLRIVFPSKKKYDFVDQISILEESK